MRRTMLTVILGALLAGTVLLTTGCAQPDDGTKIEKPSNNNNNNQNNNDQNNNNNQTNNNNQNNNNNNQNTGNGNQGNENQNPGNENQGNENENPGNGNQGNENENPGNENPGQGNENDKPGKTYEAPTNIELSNGYFIRQFMGSGQSIAKATAVDDVNHYLGEAETYIKGLVNEFEQSVNGNTYFNDFINGYKENDFYKVSGNGSSQSTEDWVISENANSYKYILKDIIKNLDNLSNREVFYTVYRTLANEAYIKGFGNLNTNNDWYTAYNDEKANLENAWQLVDFSNLGTEKFDLYDDVNNKSVKLTTVMDKLLGQAAGKGTLANVSQADLKKVINISLTTNSLGSIHDGEKSLLQHTSRCTFEHKLSTDVRDSVDMAMFNAILETTQTQDYVMER